jgi:hypothetical protein
VKGNSALELLFNPEEGTMNLKSKILGFVATAALALGIGGSALADGAQQSVTYSINSAGTLSVAIIHASNFSATNFTLSASSPTNSASYDFTVTDMRGTGAGWSVTVGASDFSDGTHTVTGATMYSSNNTHWATQLPGGLSEIAPTDSTSFKFTPASVATGVSALNSGANIINSSRTLLGSQAGVSAVGAHPNGTGAFSSEQALFLTFPNAVAVGTYTTTITLTLAGALP